MSPVRYYLLHVALSQILSTIDRLILRTLYPFNFFILLNGWICLYSVLDYKPALSRFSNGRKIIAISFHFMYIYSCFSCCCWRVLARVGVVVAQQYSDIRLFFCGGADLVGLVKYTNTFRRFPVSRFDPPRTMRFLPLSAHPVSYTHLTLPTKRIV